jgi:very-short-patch-repair endonuclease
VGVVPLGSAVKAMTNSWTQDPSRRPNAQGRGLARSLRRAATEPEKTLWRHLRQCLPLQGSHFRRQVPIGPYIADFCCFRAKLIVEVDGNQHGFDANAARDAVRTQFLESQGFQVLRFSNRDVMTSIKVVLDTIFAALETTTPTPDPCPQGRGE